MFKKQIDKSKTKKKKNPANSIIISSLAYLVMGLIMIIFPTAVENFICIALGAALIIYGVFNIISFVRDKNSNAMMLEFIIGVLATGLGLFALFSQHLVLNIVEIIIGVLIVVDNIMDIKHSIQLKKLGMKYWWIYSALATAVIILGLVTIFFPQFFAKALLILLGGILTYQGISGLCIMLTIGHYSKKANTAVIDTTATENY